MIILHNRLDKASRDFVAALDFEAGHEVIEWYTDHEKVSEYMAKYPGMSPSAFPSVLVWAASRSVPEVVTEKGTAPAHVVPAHYELVRCPASMAEVEALAAPE